MHSAVTTQESQPKRTRLIRLPVVLERYGCCRATWYQMMKDGVAPPGIKISARSVAWDEESIEELIQSRPRSLSNGRG